ncbi:MAG: hypothetical protein DSZ06_00800 [Sulfurospirillum sp.]|nr:MAG: hypothetical protein DSZ06_00800 [Sulfurospirillum sp.]
MISIKCEEYQKSKTTVFGDRVFLAKFISLLTAIVLLSIFGISRTDQYSAIKGISLSSLGWRSIDDIKSTLNSTHGRDMLVSLSEFDLSSVELKSFGTNVVKSVKDSTKPAHITKQKPKQKTKKILITSNIIKPLDVIKKRFYKTHDILYALQVATKYFQKKDYKKALKWALIANEIDSTNDNSWILFAKSKVKLGQKDDAISALKAYLKEHHSINVKKVLDDIR